ncbi:transposable element Tcb2 transposase [Trichonephila clavipes]|nr:transposable element Tcb2 transposase [Trichonephila clavipes]
MKPWILHAMLELYKGMVAQSWSGVFLWHYFGSLVRVRTSLSEIQYVELMGNYLLPFMLFCYPLVKGVFQQDNCSSLKSQRSTGSLDEHSSDFSVINCPDVNSIEPL